ncbi:hypothetical protein Tco_0296059 [Tanacetum coccineum]
MGYIKLPELGSMMAPYCYVTASRLDIMFAVCVVLVCLHFDLESYSDSDYAGANLDRKSTTGNPQQEVANFLAGDSLLGNAKSRPLWPLLQQKPNMLLLQAAVALISLTDDLSLLSNMAALESCPKHNMIAYLEKTEGNVEFHEVIDFLRRSYIYLNAHCCKVPFEKQHAPSPSPSPRPSPTPSPTPIVPDSIPEPTGENLGDHSSNDESLSGNEDDVTLQNVYDLCISLCQQVSDQAKEIKLLKAKITKLKKKAKPVIQHHKEYLKIISLQQRFPKKHFSKKQEITKFEDEVSTVKEKVSTDFEKVSTDRPKVSTDRPKVSTDESKVSTDEQVEGTEESNESSEEIFEGTEEQREGTEDKVSTDEQMEGTEDQTKEEIASKASQTSTQTPTSMTFGDDETIATLLINMSKAKAASKEKEKEEESESEDDDIPQAVKKFKQLESDEELARKIQEDWEEEEERNKIAEEKATNEALIKNFDDIKARIEADRILAEKLQEQEREQFSIEERAKFLHDTIAAQRKFLARQRSEAIRNRPPTKNQLRNQ